jgi:hypothetical protein
MASDPLSAAAAQAVTEISNAPFKWINTLFGISQAKKLATYQQNVGLLTTQQQNELNQQMLAAQTDTQRMAILDNALAQIQVARLNGGSKSKTTALIAVAAVAIVLVLAVFIIKRKE